MKMVKAEGLTYEYTKIMETDHGTEEHRVVALKNVNIEIEKGEFVVVLGHNGSGKSTFAKHINALLQPTGGTLWVKGMNTQEEGLIWEIRQTAGMVFQNPDNQLVATVVEEDIAFGPENMGVPPKEIRMRVDEALDAVRMKEFAAYTPSKLSGGQKQRIAIAGVLAMKPDCIVLDEPTAMLDPVGRRDVMETIERLNKEEGITVILITHYMDEAVRGDKVYVIDDGDLVMKGTPREIFVQVEKQQLASLVTENLLEDKSTGIQVYIGNESPIQTMKDCSVVTATYELGEGIRGTIGIVGPKRMDYEKVMDNLKVLKNSLDGILDRPKGET